MEIKYKVLVDDPFGGYAVVKSGLTKEEAEKLEKEVTMECDYFTLTEIKPDDTPQAKTK
jgi:thiamine monophosphate synthase